jgi:tetracycline repressor-like protein
VSLYVYVQNTAELHGALLDELLAGLDLPRVAVADRWRDELIGLLSSYTRLLMEYPSLARSVLTLRPYGPNYLRLIDVLLGLVHAGGVPSRQAAWGVDLLLHHATATAAEQGTRDEAVEADGEEEALVMAVREAAGAYYPNIDRARSELFSGTWISSSSTGTCSRRLMTSSCLTTWHPSRCHDQPSACFRRPAPRHAAPAPGRPVRR